MRREMLVWHDREGKDGERRKGGRKEEKKE